MDHISFQCWLTIFIDSNELEEKRTRVSISLFFISLLISLALISGSLLILNKRVRDLCKLENRKRLAILRVALYIVI